MATIYVFEDGETWSAAPATAVELTDQQLQRLIENGGKVQAAIDEDEEGEWDDDGNWHKAATITVCAQMQIIYVFEDGETWSAVPPTTVELTDEQLQRLIENGGKVQAAIDEDEK